MDREISEMLAEPEPGKTTLGTAIHYLNALVSMGCPCYGSADDVETMYCNLCNVRMCPSPEPHEPYCIWDNARKFLDQLSISTA